MRLPVLQPVYVAQAELMDQFYSRRALDLNSKGDWGPG